MSARLLTSAIWMLPAMMLAISSGCAVLAGDPDVDAAARWVAGQSADCLYTDGYQCTEFSARRYQTPAGLDSMLPAVLLAAWPVALQAFLDHPDISAAEKELHHYRIGFSEDNGQILVEFRALLMPELKNGQPDGSVLMTTYGKSARFWIDPRTSLLSRQALLR